MNLARRVLLSPNHPQLSYNRDMPATPAPPLTKPSPAVSRQWRLGIVVGLIRPVYWPLVVSLILLNAWWSWEARPHPDLKDVERWIAQDADVDVRSAAWWKFWREPHNNEGAIRALERMASESPNDARVRNLLGRAYGAKNDYLHAAEQWRAVPFWSPLKPEALYGEALTWPLLKRMRDAEIAMLAYLQVDPNHPSARPRAPQVTQWLLNKYAIQDRWDEARVLIWQAYDESLGALERRSWLELSLKTQIERSLPSATLIHAREWIAADPDDWHARRALARAANAEKLYGEADREIRTCVAAKPTDPVVWGDWVEMLRIREDFDGIASLLAKCPTEADADPRILMARGRLKRQERDFAAAADLFARAVEKTPSDPDAHNSLALALQLVGKTKEAEVHRRRHAELEETSKEIAAAVNAFKDATEAVPLKPADVKTSMLRLSQACRMMGWERDAVGWARAATEF